MLSIDINHPDVEKFTTIKSDTTKVTGANISIRLNRKFMKAVENDEDYILRFPCDTLVLEGYEPENYNKLMEIPEGEIYFKKIKAKELWNTIVKQARDNAEPGLMMWDNVLDNDPAAVYEDFKPISSNPCFHPDTVVETEYGQMKIKDINKPMKVYSMDSDGKLVMANASESFISKTNAKTLCINLRNGSRIQVTPEHKLYIRNKGWCEAQNLKIGDTLGHLCRSRRGAKYSGVHLTTSPNGIKDQVMEHKLVYGNHDINMNIHHLDRNTYNNSIENLELLAHNEHSRVTATEDNSQTHQVRDKNGKFISGPNSRRGAKTIVDLPDELKTNVSNKGYAAVVSITEGETTDVYDIQVENTHCLIANNIIAHNCGEQFLQAYDSCRLMCMNLFSMVDIPFTDKAEVDYDLVYRIAYEQQRLMDDLVDLEIEQVDKIIAKIESDPELMDVKNTELSLWKNVKKAAIAGRRTGSGITGLADMLAALGLKYDSDEALKITDKVMKTKMKAELDCSIDLAILRGSFEAWNENKEFDIIPDNALKEGKNDFYQMILDEFPEQAVKMSVYGRRNISWSTIAPTGSVSILTQTSSGCEPVFMPFYMRRKKVNPNDKDTRVDFTDQNGDTWQEYPVFHEKFKDWLQLVGTHGVTEVGNFNYVDKVDNWALFGKVNPTIEECVEQSPWYKSTANDIDWNRRLKIQEVLQRYTSNAISSTLNLPEDTTLDTVSQIYMNASKMGLKGVTIYREGSRSGVLVDSSKKDKTVFESRDAVERPKVLDAESHITTVQGTKFNVLVGLLNGKPYEVFGFGQVHFDKGVGKLIKEKKGKYTYESDTTHSLDIANGMTDEQAALTRLISTSLRHGADIQFIVEQLQKTDGDITSYTKAIARVLKKYINEDDLLARAKCQNCGSTNLKYEEGCLSCLDCGSSKCG